jgi:hypothetical protein
MGVFYIIQNENAVTRITFYNSHDTTGTVLAVSSRDTMGTVLAVSSRDTMGTVLRDTMRTVPLGYKGDGSPCIIIPII